ncbi:MAG: AMP-binding protein [Gammaproteobacteria bacterium]|nr:AMP-binding protein [Gammaproteobacteria bacterium]
MLVRDFLEAAAECAPHKTAVICDGQRWAYGEIDSMADNLVQTLRINGVKRGDRVVIYLKNCIEAVISIFGVLKASAVFVVVNRSTKAEKLAFIIKNCQATLLIADDKAPFDDVFKLINPDENTLKTLISCGDKPVNHSICPCPVLTWNEAVNRQTKSHRQPAINIDLDLACIIYTSGTTGDPKGVMCDHSSMVFVSGSIINYLENNENDIVLNVLPLSFGYGLYQLLTIFRSGATLILENSFAFPAMILQLIQQERVTGMSGVPTFYAMLLQFDFSKVDFSSLRYITNAASGLPPSHLLELQRRLPDTKIYAMYGLTEVVRALYLPPEYTRQKPDSVGIAIPGTEVWVERDGIRMGPGEVGELVVRGRHVMRGYWQAPELTAVRFRPDFIPGERLCYTGDLFKTDQDGFFYFVSRQDDIIKSRGEKVAPREVETVLHHLDGVVEAAVIGVPDAILGQAIKAVIIKDEKPLTEREVLAHCRVHLEDFMVPKYVEFVTSLPKSPSGKVLKGELV